MRKILDFIYGMLFIAVFIFVASGMLECVILALLERLGL